MKFANSLPLLSAAGLATALAFAPDATASNVGFNLTVGGPGYAVTVGNHGYAHGFHAYPHRPYAPYIAHVPTFRPYAPAYYAPVVAAPYYIPAPVVVRPAPVMVRPVPVYRPFVGARVRHAYDHAHYRHDR